MRATRSGALLCASMIALSAAGSACSADSGGPPPDAGTAPSFPEDVVDRYREMRDCRHSHEHDLRFIRVFVSADAVDPYAALSPDHPYPVGANLVKLEYDDEQCTELLEYTAMTKLEPGAQPDGGDWRWERVSRDREVLERGAPARCVVCHTHHCDPPFGFDLTCAEEL